MPSRPLIDLHTHSNVSDGTESPATVMAAAADAGLDVLGLTDHDSTAGWQAAVDAVPRTGVALVRGAEISASWRGTSVHLLSYLHDPGDPELEAALARCRRARDERARLMVEGIARDYDLEWAEVEAQLEPGATVGRPHIADALVARGHVADRTEAFDSILSGRGPYYVPYYAPDVLDAVRMVRRAGGVPVMAHPRAATRGRTVPEEVIEAMAEAGLAGLEIHHRDHAPEAVRHLTDLARSLDLLITGASDYHGTGKPNRLGENVTSPDVLEEIEHQGSLEVITP